MYKNNRLITLSSAVFSPRLLAGLGAIILVLVAIFPLATWAEAATWHHGFQHMLIFGAGTVMGAVLLTKNSDTRSNS